MGSIGSFHVMDANSTGIAAARGALSRSPREARKIDRRAGHDGRVIIRVTGCEDQRGRGGAAWAGGVSGRPGGAGAAARGQDEWWAEDLEGCAIRDGERQRSERSKRLLALPSCEVLEVERGAGGADLLVPLVIRMPCAASTSNST